MEDKLYNIDGLLWRVDTLNELATPICPKHFLELTFEDLSDWGPISDEKKYIDKIRCEDCEKSVKLPRNLQAEEDYVVSKVRAMDYKDYDIVDIDGTLTPVTKKERATLDNEYFCTTQVRDSKRGPQVVIYAGKKGLKTKSQIFITPEERRLSFDQNDINPADIFARITAEFKDGSKQSIESSEKQKKDEGDY